MKGNKTAHVKLSEDCLPTSQYKSLSFLLACSLFALICSCQNAASALDISETIVKVEPGSSRGNATTTEDMDHTEEANELHEVVDIKTENEEESTYECESIPDNSLEIRNHYIEKNTFQINRSEENVQYIDLNKSTDSEQCKKTYQANNIPAHLGKVLRRKLKCPYCTQVCERHTVLASHLLATHTYYPYRCAICQKKFTRRGDCLEHILNIHVPVRPYKCAYCGVSFSQFKHLKGHVRKDHNQDLKLEKKPLRAMTKIIIYPHMQLNISHIDEETLKKTNIVISDYKDEKTIPCIDYSDFVFTETKPKLVFRGTEITKITGPIVSQTGKCDSLTFHTAWFVGDSVRNVSDLAMEDLQNQNAEAVFKDGLKNAVDEKETAGVLLVSDEDFKLFKSNNGKYLTINGVDYEVETG